MSIHQIQVRYDPAADRLLLQLNTTEGDLFQVWLTRRMLSQFYPTFRRIVVAAGVAQAAPMAVPVPEARRMLEEAAMQRPLAGADFEQPFAAAGSRRPLGPEPLLPQSIELTPAANGAASLALHDAQGRRIEMALNSEMTNALLRLLEAALPAADWQLGPPAGPPADEAEAPAAAAPPRVLN